jgi:hypothetical protein
LLPRIAGAAQGAYRVANFAELRSVARDKLCASTVSLSTQILIDDDMGEAIEGTERAVKGQHK